MKGASLVSTDHSLYEKASDYLVRAGGRRSTNETVVQRFDDQGRLFTLYRTGERGFDLSEGPIVAAPGVSIPDPAAVVGHDIECRWEDLFVAEVGRIAALADGETWVLDGDGVLWSATDIDIHRLRL